MRIHYAILFIINSLSFVFAQEGGASASKNSAGSIFNPTMIGMILMMFVIMYFLMIRPEQKRQKEKQNMLNNLKKGDKIVTLGGIIGTISGIKEDSIILKVADNTNIRILKTAISTVKEKADNDEDTNEDEKK